MLECPSEYVYSHRHMWAEVNEEEQTALIGITEDKVEELPEILSIDMPMTGDELEMDADCLHLHFETGIQILYAPLTGRVLEINRDVLDTPELLHAAPYRNWLFKMEYDETEEFEMLMNSKRYMQFLDHLDVK